MSSTRITERHNPTSTHTPNNNPISPRTPRTRTSMPRSTDERVGGATPVGAISTAITLPAVVPIDSPAKHTHPAPTQPASASKPSIARVLSNGRTGGSISRVGRGSISSSSAAAIAASPYARKPSITYANTNITHTPTRHTQTAANIIPTAIGSPSSSPCKHPSGPILTALTTGKKDSLNSTYQPTARSSLERNTSGTSRTHIISPPAHARKPSLVRVDSRYRRRPSASVAGGGGSVGAAHQQESKDSGVTPRERIGRNGQPLAARSARKQYGASIDPQTQYILNSKGQLGLEPARETRFDPLADTDNDQAALVMPAPSVSGSVHGRDRQGTRIIARALAAQKAGKKWHQDVGVVHIAAGVVLPPLAVATLASGILQSRSQHSSKKKRSSPPAPSSLTSTAPITPTLGTPPTNSTDEQTTTQTNNTFPTADSISSPTIDDGVDHDPVPRTVKSDDSESKTPVTPPSNDATHAPVHASGAHSSTSDQPFSPLSPSSAVADPASPPSHTHAATRRAPRSNESPVGGLNPRRKRRSLELEEDEHKEAPAAAPASHSPISVVSSLHAAPLSPSSDPNTPRLARRVDSFNTGAVGPSGAPTDAAQSAKGRIERRTTHHGIAGSISPNYSPALGPVNTHSPPSNTLTLSPSITSMSPAAAAAGDSFQQSNAATMSSDAIQDRWRRNLIKRMSLNITFSPPAVLTSGLLAGTAAAPAQDRSPNSASSGPMKSGSFSKEATPGGAGIINTDHHAQQRERERDAQHAHGVNSRRASRRQSALPKASRASGVYRHGHGAVLMPIHPTRHEAAHVNSQFSFLFPHQELLSQQREFYDTCNKKMFDYLHWHDDQDMDPVIIPASAHPNYLSHAQYRPPQRQSHGSPLPSPDGSISFHHPLVGYPMPASLPSSFDLNFWFCYSTIQNWDTFDIFDWTERCEGWPLSFMFVVVMKKSGLFTKLKMDEKVAFRWIQEVESHYLPNPYHCTIHAADVLHAVYHFLNDSILKDHISPVDQFLLYFSCAIHDFSHPGQTNAFLVATRAPLAIRYNDRHVLESFHVASAFRMMQLTSGCSILEAWDYDRDPKVYSRCRKMIIDMVLATDLAQHFDLLRTMKGRFEQMMAQQTTNTNTNTNTGAHTNTTHPTADADTNTTPNSDSSTIAPTTGRHEKVTAPTNNAEPAPHPSSTTVPPSASSSSSSSSPPACSSPVSPSPSLESDVSWLNLSNDADTLLVLQLLLKLGDLSHPARPKNLHLRWAELVTEEFFMQGDMERSLNMTPSMFMDRYTTNVATSQLGFLTFLVRPLAELATRVFRIGMDPVRRVDKNLDLWVELEKVEKREQAQKEADAYESSSNVTSGANSLDTASTDLTELVFDKNSTMALPPAVPTSLHVNHANDASHRVPSPPGSSLPSGDDPPLPPPSSSSTPSHHPHASGSGGRFGSYCKDRTVLSMFQKVRELDMADEGESGDGSISLSSLPPVDLHRSPSLVDGDDAAQRSVSLDRLDDMPTAPTSDATIMEEPISPRGFNDGSMPNTPPINATM